MDLQEALKIRDDHQWLVDKIFNEIRVTHVEVMPENSTSSEYKEALRLIAKGKNHIPFITEKGSDFKVSPLFLHEVPHNYPYYPDLETVIKFEEKGSDEK